MFRATFKLYKFYDLSMAKMIETIAVSEQLARDNLGKPFLIFVVRKHICPMMTQQSNMLGGTEHA